MVAATFDTLKAKETLTNAGVEDKQATAIVDLTRESVSERVATKEDIVDLKMTIAYLKIGLLLGLFAATVIVFIALRFLVN